MKASEERLSREEIFNKILVLMASANRAEVRIIEASSHIVRS